MDRPPPPSRAPGESKEAKLSELLMVVGSLNRETPYFQGAHGVGLSVFGFDPVAGTARLLAEDGGIDNPTFLSADTRSGCLYAGTEVFGWHEGTISAYRFDAASQRLVYLNKQPSLGSITAHNAVTQDGRHLLVTNYGLGPEREGPDAALAVFPLRPDGSLGAPVSSVAHRGRGPDPLRQERAHPHCAQQSPDGRFVLVADLGLDAIVTYGLSAEGQLSPQPVASVRLPPGSGPRHILFHPDGRLLLAICELTSTVVSLRYAPDEGTLEPAATVSTLPDGWQDESYCSDIRFAPGGRFAYAANRGQNGIAILAVDGDTGALSRVGHANGGGVTPRHLAVDPTGRILLVCNQNSDTLGLLAIEAGGAVLRPAGQIEVGSPMCVAFLSASPS